MGGFRVYCRGFWGYGGGVGGRRVGGRSTRNVVEGLRLLSQHSAPSHLANQFLPCLGHFRWVVTVIGAL